MTAGSGRGCGVTAGSGTAEFPTATWSWEPSGSPKCPIRGCAHTRALCSCPVVVGVALLELSSGFSGALPCSGHTQGQQVGTKGVPVSPVPVPKGKETNVGVTL